MISCNIGHFQMKTSGMRNEVKKNDKERNKSQRDQEKSKYDQGWTSKSLNSQIVWETPQNTSIILIGDTSSLVCSLKHKFTHLLYCSKNVSKVGGQPIPG